MLSSWINRLRPGRRPPREKVERRIAHIKEGKCSCGADVLCYFTEEGHRIVLCRNQHTNPDMQLGGSGNCMQSLIDVSLLQAYCDDYGLDFPNSEVHRLPIHRLVLDRTVCSVDHPGHVLYCTILDAMKLFVVSHNNQEPSRVHLTSDMERLINQSREADGTGYNVRDHGLLGMAVTCDASSFRLE